jgi:2-polyprenyl-3-methyl-5-hydroxy-6-metoxy-1,4-benzoquinol methylase
MNSPRAFSRDAGVSDLNERIAPSSSTMDDHSYPNVSPASRRPPAGSESDTAVSHVEVAEANDRPGYNWLDYQRYEAGCPAVEAKKVLEMDCMTSVIKQLARRKLPKVCLDIGCATGRWPLWAARQGYECHGYDISNDAIAICIEQAAANPTLQLRFELHDIADGVLEHDYFSLVTCMMGTINHVTIGKRGDFLHGIASTMRAGGTFAFTSWNFQSPFCDFLALESQQARAAMRRNMSRIEDLLEEARTHGFDIVSVIPLCFLPNQCFEAWQNSLANVQVIAEVDTFLRHRLPAEGAQMYFVQCQKRSVQRASQ